MPYKDPAKRAARYRVWYAAHREERRAYEAARRAAHRDEIAARKRARRVPSPGEARARDRAYYAARDARRYERRPWWQAAKHAAWKFGEKVPPAAWAAVWSGTCFGCGKTPAEGVDHIIPKVRGGRNVVKNLQPACLPCNVKKGVRPGLSRRRWPSEPPRGRALTYHEWLLTDAGRASRIVREPATR